MKHSEYPIGASWTIIDNRGRRGWITLSRREKNFDVWAYGWVYSDGSGGNFDWAVSYAIARKNHWIQGRFKRVI